MQIHRSYDQNDLKQTNFIDFHTENSSYILNLNKTWLKVQYKV